MITVILNPASGAGGKPELARGLTELFRTAGRESRIVQVSAMDDVARAVKTAIDSKAEVVVAGGGDGTVSAVASVLAGGSTPLGVLPLGTLNHFAKDLHIPLDLGQAVGTIAQGHVRRVDVGLICGRVFINNCSIGIYPSIVEARERLRQRGHRKWASLATATVEVLRRDEDVCIHLDNRRTQIFARTPFLFVGNNEYQAEGIHLGERMSMDGGLLYAYFAPPVRTRDLPTLFARALLGYARRERALQSVSGAELWVDTPWSRDIKVACDGELMTMRPTLHYRAWPGALGVMAPAV